MVFDALTGKRPDAPKAGPRADFRPTASGHYALASNDGGLHVIRGESAQPLYTWHAAAGDAYLVTTPRGYYSGDPATARRFHRVTNDASHPLDGHAAALLDPKRVAAIAAGVEVLPAHPGAPPTVTVESPEGRFVKIEGSPLTLEVLATDDEAVLGFEVQQDGERLDPTRIADSTTFQEDGRRARLRLELAAPTAETALRIRARDRQGLLSRPAWLTLTSPRPDRSP